MAYSDEEETGASPVKTNAFKREFKRYKARQPPPDLSEVIDLSDFACSLPSTCTSFHVGDLLVHRTPVISSRLNSIHDVGHTTTSRPGDCSAPDDSSANQHCLQPSSRNAASEAYSAIPRESSLVQSCCSGAHSDGGPVNGATPGESSLMKASCSEAHSDSGHVYALTPRESSLVQSFCSDAHSDGGHVYGWTPRESSLMQSSCSDAHSDGGNVNGLTPRESSLMQLSYSDAHSDGGHVYGLTPRAGWLRYEFADRPGLVIVPGLLSARGQMMWTSRCLRNYILHPNVTNLDGNTNNSTGDCGLGALPRNSIIEDRVSMKRLRWLTLGYHYDWSQKVYRETHKSQFPDDLKEMVIFVAHSLGYHSFQPESCIVNFYPPNSTLSGHVDRSEWNLSTPLFSFSFGQSAVYLSGGQSLDEKPIAIRLHGGDALVMAGDQRLVYHGVPKVFVGRDFSKQLDSLDDTDSHAIHYLNANRVNLTVRQVN